jgi:tryptophanyl-tRNA synthetase
LARAFNHEYGAEVFVLPQAKVLQDSAKVPGTDGEKMSKSYNNFIEVFEDSGSMRKKVMRIATDSRPMEEPKDPGGDHLFQLYALFASESERAEMAALYQRGGFGYGQVKKALADAADRFFDPFRQRRAELAARPDHILQILADGAARARKKAGEVLNRAKEASGLIQDR